MRRTWLQSAGAVLGVFLLAGGAEASTDQLVERVAVRSRLFEVAGRWEAGLSAGLTPVNALTEHFSFGVSGAYNLREWVAFELRAGTTVSRHTSLANQVEREFLRAVNQRSTVDDLSDLWELTHHGALGVRFQPVYGKLNLLSELPVHFQFYGWLGGGAAALRRSSVVLCAARQGDGSCPKAADGSYAVLEERRVAPVLATAVGLRLFVAKHHGLRVELRDWAFLDAFHVGVKPSEQSSTAPTAGGRRSPNPGVTNVTVLELGYALLF